MASLPPIFLQLPCCPILQYAYTQSNASDRYYPYTTNRNVVLLPQHTFENTNMHTPFILLADRIFRWVKTIPAVHNPSINWISSSIGTSAVLYFSPLFSLYVLTWDCPKKCPIYFNIQFAWKIKMGFHTLPGYRHTREQKYFTSLRTAVPIELIGTPSWIKNGNDYLLSTCGIFMMIHSLQKLIYFANLQIDNHKKQPSECTNLHSILLTFLF